MKLGLQLPVFAADGAGVAEFARAAEDLGFDSVWTGDHLVIPAEIASSYPYAWRFPGYAGSLFPTPAFLEAVALCGFVAAATSRVDIGIGVLVLPMRNPVALAKELATLDVLSGGRVIAGVGTGWLTEEFDALGVPSDRRGARTDEAIAILRLLWGEEQPATFDGTFWSFGGVYCQPVPPRPGGVPIWIGGHTEVALRRCARLGTGWHAIELPPAEFAARSARLDELLTAQGRAAGEVERSVATRLRLSGRDLSEAVALISAYEDAGCDHLIINSTPSRPVADNIGRAARLRTALEAAA
jgi:probable F420-dependent oxidoreductase